MKASHIPGIFALLAQVSCGHLFTRRRPSTLAQRLAELPLANAPLAAKIEIRWNAQMVPYIFADSERDAATGLGMIHAHLRLSQITFLRQISQGRMAEFLGPAAIDIDHTLRILDFGRSTPANLAALSASTLNWLEGFVAGINHVIDHVNQDKRRQPEELTILGVQAERWNVSDVLSLSRLSCADFTWKVWTNLLPLRERSDWSTIWQNLMQQNGGPPIPGHHRKTSGHTIDWLSDHFGKPGGSNSMAINPQLSDNGAAILAGDPHLPITLPNLWLMAGVHCPTMKVAGFMLPGMPAIMVGRSPDIAWGGTSMHATSSDLFDISDLPKTAIRQRQEHIKVRWGRDQKLTINECDWGPILSDAPMFGGKKSSPNSTKSKPRFAMRWVGHDPSDEISALLGAARASNFTEFRGALESFAVAGQNMLYADTSGNIGQVMAAHLPARPAKPAKDMILARSELRFWQTKITSAELPRSYNPAEGFVASANNRPSEESPYLISNFYSPDDRIRRLRQILGGDAPASALWNISQDVSSPTALPLRDAMLALVSNPNNDKLKPLLAWDGVYDIDSQGALFFELSLYHFAIALHGEDALAVFTANWDPRGLLRAELAKQPESKLRAAIDQAFSKAAADTAKYERWGNIHRLKLAHPLAALPLFGRRWRFADEPIAGANETIMKSAHGFAKGKHYVRMSSNARHLCDMSDIDANWFVLLGGQDGDPGSACFLDQWPLWQKGEMLQMPLRADTIRTLFSYSTKITPAHCSIAAKNLSAR